MAKKCIPGVICIENITLLILLVLICGVAFLLFVNASPNKQTQTQTPSQFAFPFSHYPPSSAGQISHIPLGNIPDPLHDSYSPPLKTDTSLMPVVNMSVVPVVPVNVKTQGGQTEYQQIGILSNNAPSSSGQPMILPLMGRRIHNGRDKWQYYAIGNSVGSGIQTKLPVSLEGKSCTGEYGCTNISNGDNVYVEGYNDVFRATIYETGLLSYIPYV